MVQGGRGGTCEGKGVREEVMSYVMEERTTKQMISRNRMYKEEVENTLGQY